MLKKLFGFDPATNSVRTEVIAGITTFLTMAYILAVNPDILSATGMDKGALFTTTVVASALATLLMAFLAKLPFGLGPGMGLNAFFAFSVCLGMGYSWQFALTAVFIEGLLFILLSVTNLRTKIVEALPACLRNSIGAGIGLFIAFIGLKNAGIIVNSDATLVTLGNVTSGPALLGLIGIIITSVLLVRNVRGALLIGILVTTLIGIPMGLTDFKGVFSLPPSMSPIMFKLQWEHIFTKDMAIIVFTFLFVDMFDTIGTLVGVTTKAGMVDEKGRVPRINQAFMSDALGTTFGALLGTSTITTFVESAAGVSAGGRTGLTAFATAMCFLVALFFAPLFLSIPGAATAPALVLVGLMMITCLVKVDLTDFSEAIPAFICLIFMPLTYSISEGIVFGLLSYVAINLICGNHKKIGIGTYVLAAIFLLKYII